MANLNQLQQILVKFGLNATNTASSAVTTDNLVNDNAEAFVNETASIVGSFGNSLDLGLKSINASFENFLKEMETTRKEDKVREICSSLNDYAFSFTEDMSESFNEFIAFSKKQIKTYNDEFARNNDVFYQELIVKHEGKIETFNKGLKLLNDTKKEIVTLNKVINVIIDRNIKEGVTDIEKIKKCAKKYSDHIKNIFNKLVSELFKLLGIE